MRSVLPGWLCAALVLIPSAGLAQTPPSGHRIFVGIGFLGTSKSMARSREFTSTSVVFHEIATKHADYPAPSLANWFPIDVSGGVRLWRVLEANVTYSRLVYEDLINLDATIPHPTFLNASATGDGTTGATLTRTESAIHVALAAVLHAGDPLEVRLFAGPSFFRYSADMASDVLYDQTFDTASPVNSITVTGATSQRASGSAMGFHVGGDFGHTIGKRFDLVGTIRCSWGTVTLDREPLSGLSQQIRVGGVQGFVGLRIHGG